MCGIVGYIGKEDAQPILLDGLRRLEYRGYDSAGIAILEPDQTLRVTKAVGKVAALADKLTADARGTIGIAHTRWATHGTPTETNAHPHQDCTGRLALVHNGIIENYQELRRELVAAGHRFTSQTDTETLTHLIEAELANRAALEQAVVAALTKVEGTFGIAVIDRTASRKLVLARRSSPILIGIGVGEYLIASDASAILGRTNQVIYLEDNEVALITPGGHRIFTLAREPINRRAERLDGSPAAFSKGGYRHFMEKEIFEQPEALENTLRGRLNFQEGTAQLGSMTELGSRLQYTERIMIVACGTARHAGLVGELLFEELAGIPTEVDYASEFRYRALTLPPNTAVIAVSQSGETADTLAAVREAKRRGALTLGIVNAVGSTIAREVDAGIYNHVGPELAVASTKAYLSQIAIFALLALALGRMRRLTVTQGQAFARALTAIPDQIRQFLHATRSIEEVARRLRRTTGMFYLGRKYNHPTALEGALKIKELAYLQAEGYPAGEMKHGPIAMVDRRFPSVLVAPTDSVTDKLVSAAEELRARRGPIIAITDAASGGKFARLTDALITIPETIEPLTPMLAVVPLQLLAYYAAAQRGRDIDQPRNLAKSVTVE